MIHKSNKAYKSIGEVAKILDLVNKKKGMAHHHPNHFYHRRYNSKDFLRKTREGTNRPIQPRKRRCF